MNIGRRAPLFLMLLALLALLLQAPAGAAKGGLFPFPISQQQLDNGLKVVMVPCDSPGIVAYYTVVRAGSRNEVEPGHSGFAHLFEHLMFRGTKKFSASQYNKALKGMGVDDNAFTSDDLTCYHVTGSSANLEKIVEIEADRFQNLQFSEEEYKTETGAVLGEYRKNFSNPLRAMEEKLQDLAFDVHTYKHTTMGFLKDIEAMPGYYQYCWEFFRRYYRPDNCTLVVVGDFDEKRLMALVTKYYGGWLKGADPRPIPVEPSQKEEKRFAMTWKNRTLPLMLIGYHMPAFSDRNPEVPALHILSEYLFSSSSPLYRKLVIEEQRADLLFGYVDDHRDPYLYYIYVRAKDEAELPKLEKEIFAAIDEAKSGAVAPQRIRDIASNMKYSFAAGLDTPDGVAYQLSYAIALTDDPLSLDRYYAMLDGITPKLLQETAAKYFGAHNRTVVTLTYGGDR